MTLHLIFPLDFYFLIFHLGDLKCLIDCMYFLCFNFLLLFACFSRMCMWYECGQGVHMTVQVNAPMSAFEARRGCWGFSIVLCLLALRVGISLHCLGLAGSSRSSQDQLSLFQLFEVTHTGCGNLNSDPHDCTGSTLTHGAISPVPQ